ncbi:MAG: L,D-transpeptidase [Labilithrix sp.]|nr:L,D-transpeptidase [Labilithrix sp.]
MRVLGLLACLLLASCRREADPQAASAAGTPGSASLTSAEAPGPKVGRKDEGSAPSSDLPSLPKGEGAPIVALDGSSRPWPPPLPEGVAKIAALAMDTPVLATPDVFAPRLGTLRAGGIVEMDPKPVSGKGCTGGFRAIKPLGFVCIGTATLDLNHPVVRASTRRPDHTQRMPYIYGLATRGGPAYATLPSAKDLSTFEPNLKTHLARWANDPVSGASYGPEIWTRYKSEPPPSPLLALDEKRSDAELPWFLQNGGRVPPLASASSGDTAKAGEFSRRNGISFVDTLLWEGRRYNVGVDLRLYPADRFRPIKGSDFHGFRIPQEARMPFAIVKSKKARIVREGPGGKLIPDEPVPWRTTVQTTGRQRVQKGKYYDELEGGGWIADDEVARVEVARKMPGWANDGEKWIDVNVTRQILVAYEGTKPVYATLVSTGEAGLDDPAKTRSTKRGIFRIHTKYLSAKMDSNVVGEEFELRDVPYVQYFTEGYALHAAYWHDVFGQPKSHGCINLAPEDARRLFFWTEPQIPAQWHGAVKGKTGTVIFVHP